MDLKLLDASPTPEERAAVDARLGPPRSQWDGGARGALNNGRDAHVAYGGREQRERRHLLLPALQALQARVGWISEGGFNYVCERLGVPPADAWGVATFYAMLATSPRPTRVLHVCDDVVCRVRGGLEVCHSLEQQCGPAIAHGPDGRHVRLDGAKAGWMHSPCLGLCDQAPAALLTEAGSAPRETLFGSVTAKRAHSLVNDGTENGDAVANHVPQHRSSRRARARARDPEREAESLLGAAGEFRLLKRIGVVDPTSLHAYRLAGGYQALEKALAMGPEAVIREVTESNLLGRGGAAFPTGRKWDAVRQQKATPHYLVCNADESEPGTFRDHVLLTLDPFAIVEAMTIAAFAAGCEKGYVYVRAEYPLGAERMQNAIHQARSAGLLGRHVMDRDFAFDIEVRRGAGAYICGEETAMFESIEGKRGEPRNKPPFPVQHGLFGKPTVVNNVETLANVLVIISEGAAAFKKVGTPQSTGTRLFCVSGHVARPGVYEVPMGITLRALLEMAGSPEPGARSPEQKRGSSRAPGSGLRAVLLGGAAGTFIRPDELDLKLTHEDTRAAGTTLGSGVAVVFDDSVDLHDIVLRIAAFFRDESCGQCVPCRVGTVRQEEALHRIAKGRTLGGVSRELALLDEVGAAMKDGSICGLGQTAYSAVESAIKRLRLYDGAPA